MKKSFVYFSALMALFTMPFAFTSCDGSGSDDGDPATDSRNTRIEVSFSGDYSMFSPTTGFYAFGLNGKGLKMQTSDGEKETNWNRMYDDAPYNTVSAEINDYFSTFNVSIVMMNYDNTEGSVAITGKVFHDGKLHRADVQQIEFKPGMTAAVYTYDQNTGFTNTQY